MNGDNAQEITNEMRRVLTAELNSLSRTLASIDQSAVEIVTALRNAVDGQGKIVVLGVGKNSHIAAKCAATLTSTGSPAVALDPMNALHGDLGLIQDGDAIIALSYSGETDELLQVIPHLRKFEVTIIACTGNRESSLATRCDLTLAVEIEKEACPLELAPTSSTTCTLAILDAIAMALLSARGFGRNDFARYHPGGALGRKLLARASELMRPTDRLVLVETDCLVKDVITTMAETKNGAAIIVDDVSRLKGLFTHGDFARAYKDDPIEIGDQEVASLMTANPITVKESDLALDVVDAFREHRIDEIIVINSISEVVGLIDSQDLARMRIH
ncbi:MAG: KpsF/GutQ family sugar-phosphate isomerase [Verrucomicrobiota bacterium]